MNQSLLLVEDDESTAAFLTDNLVADGFAVAVATGAAEGIRQIEVRHPALVLLDLTLDDGNGLIYWTVSGRRMGWRRGSTQSCR